MGKNLPETRKLRTGDVDANLMAKALGRWNCSESIWLSRFHPWESVQKASAKTTGCFFLGKIYRLAKIDLDKRFPKLQKKPLAKVWLKWTKITFEEVSFGTLDFLRQCWLESLPRVCLACMTSEITGNETLKCSENRFWLQLHVLRIGLIWGFKLPCFFKSWLQGKRPRLNRQDCCGLRARRWWWPGALVEFLGNPRTWVVYLTGFKTMGTKPWVGLKLHFFWSALQDSKPKKIILPIVALTTRGQTTPNWCWNLELLVIGL